MKHIDINGRQKRPISREIALGNGVRIIFNSKRDAIYFVSETNRFLTECLVIINDTYTSAFMQYRNMWLISSNTKNGTKTHYFDVQKRIRSTFDIVEQLLNKFYSAHYGSNDPFFSFINLEKAASFLKDSLYDMETFNKARNITAAYYQCKTLKKRCSLVIEEIKKYGTDVRNKLYSDNRPNGIFLSIDDFMKLKGFKTQQSAWQFAKEFSKNLGKSSPNHITIDEFCSYYKIKKENVLVTLNQ